MKDKPALIWFLAFLVYFAAHSMIRTSLGWFLTEDEIAIMRDAQNFAWIYDGQMPLYAWSQSAIFNVFGPTLLSLTLLKNAIMLLICLSVFTLVERVSNTTFAFAATASMLFVPQLVWTSQHTLTTPVLGTLFAATTLLSFSRLTENRSPVRYGLFGAMMGLGAISSVTYLLVPAALIPAALTTRSHRKIFFSPWIIVSLIVAAAIAARPYHALWQSGGVQLPDLSILVPVSAMMFMDRAVDMYQAMQVMLTFTGILILTAAAAVYSGLGRSEPVNEETSALRELLLRTFSFGVLLVFALAYAMGSAWMDQTNLQPLLFLAAPVLALYLFPAMSRDAHCRAIRLSGAIAVVVLIVTPAHYSFSDAGIPMNQQAALGPDDIP